jgi:hypothetical protein
MEGPKKKKRKKKRKKEAQINFLGSILSFSQIGDDGPQERNI